MSIPIFGFVGRAKSGKDAAAKLGMLYLAEAGRHKSTRIALADPLKEVCISIFGETFDLSPSVFTGSQADKNSDIAQIPNWTGRKILQHIGTEGFRHVHPDIWVLHALAKANRYLSDGYKAIFISDVRFVNEARLIKDAGGILVRITRNIADDGVTEGIVNHASENEISLISTDAVINNNGTLDDLNQKVRALLCQHLPSLHLM